MLGEPPLERPDLSVVVVVHDMAREAPRTLLSLSAGYQRDIAADDYEVIVVDNGSRVPLSAEVAAGLDGRFRFIRIDSAPRSPAHAINRGLAEAQGQVIGVMIDGARMVTPRVLHFARTGARLYPRAVVATLGWYLGSDFQSHSVLAGYDARAEDELLGSINWTEDGYRLFDISTPDESSNDGWLAGPGGTGCIFESNALFASRATWELIGGADERFTSPGGGLLNFDLFRRAMELPDARLVLLLGEATFHQIHGGIATNAPPARFRERYVQWAAEYCSIRGHPYRPPTLSHAPACVGTLHRSALSRLARTAIDPLRRWPQRPLGPTLDLWRWPDEVAPAPTDPTIAALVSLMRTEFEAGRYDAVAVIARLTRARAPHEPEPLRLLRLIAPYYDQRASGVEERDPRFHLAVGKAHLLLGEVGQAADAFRRAFAGDPNLAEARVALASYAPASTMQLGDFVGST